MVRKQICRFYNNDTMFGFITTHFSIASISNWCTCSPLRLCYVTHIMLADTPRRCAWCNVTSNL